MRHLFPVNWPPSHQKRNEGWQWIPIPGAAKKQRLGDEEGFRQTVMDAAMRFLDGEAQVDDDQDEVIAAVVHAEG